MTNAKEEFISATEGLKVVCAFIQSGISYFLDDDDDQPTFILKKGYTPKDYEQFLNSLDFDYDNGYGSQYLYGIVWCEYGKWLTRGEYDGSEWWEEHSYPPIPDYCL